MPNLTSEFFVQLGEREHDPWLAYCTGTIRFDLENGGRHTRGGNGAEHWLVSIREGQITVETDGVGQDTAADATFHADRALFELVIRGEANATAAMLRGAAQVEGDPALLVRFRHLFPGPVTRKAATA
jgi:SCP-2 sterol transfer family